MTTAELVNGRISLETDWRERDLVRQVPGTKWDRETRLWSLPLSWANCLTLRGVFGDELELGPELAAWGFRELETRIEPAMEARARAMDPAQDTEGDPRLFSYQRTGVEFLYRAECAVLADDMGTGKTVQSVMTLERANAYPALIVCPNSVKRTWADEFAKWAPHRKVVVVSGSATKRRKLLAEDADVFVVNYESMRLHTRLAGYGSIRLLDKEKEPGELNRMWGAVVADEAHRVKAPKAKQTRALWAIGETALRRLCLTGTPVANDPADFWTLLRFVSPKEWPSRSKFIDRYCATAFNPFGGVDVVGLKPETRDEFFRVVEPRFLRRQKAIVLPQLPPKVYVRRSVELAPKQAKVYKSLRDGMVAELDSGTIESFDSLSLLTRLSQAACAYPVVEEQEQEDGSVKKVITELVDPSAKLDALDDILAETDEPVVVFAASRKLIELASARLTKRGVEHACITGTVSEQDRDIAKARFQAGGLKVLLLTLGAGAAGLTLTAAPTLVFLQRSWSLVENRQAEDRIHRPGAEKWESVTIIDIVAEDTIEDNVADALEGKSDMLEQVTRDTETLRKLLCGD